MGKVNNKSCIICKTGYHYCPNCGSDSGKPSWYHIFDSQNCHDIYEICTQYRDKVINAETAYNLISKLDLSKLDNFAEGTKLQIKEIIKLHEETTVEVVVEEEKVKNTEEVIEEVAKKNYANNAKFYKKNK